MGQFICGKNSVKDAIDNKLPIKKIFVSRIFDFEIPQNIEVKFLKKSELDKLTKEKHQGIIAELIELNYFHINEVIKDKPSKVLMIDHIQDPHNLGAILRSANAFGIKHIILPKERSVGITIAVLKVSSGGFVGLKIIKIGSLVNAIQILKKHNFWIYASALTEKSINIKNVLFNKPMVLIVGNEQKGVSRSLLKISDELVFIDMKGTVQSLNVSVATGILLFKI